MRQIKFRGVDKITGKKVYGYYCPFGDIASIETEAGGVEIEPESLSQLIAVDKNGVAVYEGDRVIDDFGGSCVASFEHYAAIIEGKSYACIG